MSEREKKENQWNRLDADIVVVDEENVQAVYKKAETQTYSFDHVFYKPETPQVFRYISLYLSIFSTRFSK